MSPMIRRAYITCMLGLINPQGLYTYVVIEQNIPTTWYVRLELLAYANKTHLITYYVFNEIAGLADGLINTKLSTFRCGCCVASNAAYMHTEH